MVYLTREVEGEDTQRNYFLFPFLLPILILTPSYNPLQQGPRNSAGILPLHQMKKIYLFA